MRCLHQISIADIEWTMLDSIEMGFKVINDLLTDRENFKQKTVL